MTAVRKVAMITGGTRGIGLGIARELAASGFDLAINGRREASEVARVIGEMEFAGSTAIYIRADIAHLDSHPRLLATIRERFGRLDVLVNNAGTTVNVPIKDLDGLSVEAWDRVFAVNVRGLFLVTRAAAPLLKEAHGCVVNTASIVGLRPGPQPLPYSASKAAVVSLTKTLAFALAPEVRVNAVAPGWMEGEWMERMLGDNYEGLMGRRAKATPLKRCATADDVAEAMMCLVQSMKFVTGEIIVIDGGFTSYT
jgi:3-oxoacyl-[acyl-carrier protein] reductase